MGDTIPDNPITGGSGGGNAGSPDPNSTDPVQHAQIVAAQKKIDEQNRLLGFESNFNALNSQQRAAQAAFQQAQDQQSQVAAQKATGQGGAAGAVNVSPLQQNLNDILAKKQALSFSTDVPEVQQQYQAYLNDANANTNNLTANQISANRQGQQYQDYINSANNILAQNTAKEKTVEDAALKQKQDAAAASTSGLSVDPYAIKKKPLSNITLNSNSLSQDLTQAGTSGNGITGLQSNRI